MGGAKKRKEIAHASRRHAGYDVAVSYQLFLRARARNLRARLPSLGIGHIFYLWGQGRFLTILVGCRWRVGLRCLIVLSPVF